MLQQPDKTDGSPVGLFARPTQRQQERKLALNRAFVVDFSAQNSGLTGDEIDLLMQDGIFKATRILDHQYSGG